MADFDPIQAGAIAVQDDQPFDPLKAGAIPAEKEASPTPETDKALATTAAAAPRMPASVFLGQSGTNYRPEDSFDPTKHPVAEKVAGAAVEKLGGMIPRSALDVAGMATPVVPAIQSLISDAHTFKPHFENAKAQLSGQPLPHPEIAAKTFDQFNQDDWIRFGVSNAVDLANAALLRKGMFRAGEPVPKIRQTGQVIQPGEYRLYRGVRGQQSEIRPKYFSDDPNVAQVFSDGEVGQHSVKLDNPLFTDNPEDYVGLTPSDIEKRKAEGYDGIVYKKGQVVIPFDKSQISPVSKIGEAPTLSGEPKIGGGEVTEEIQKGRVETQGTGQEEPQIASPLASTVESTAASVPESASAVEPPSPTSIKNLIVDQERVVRGLQPAMEPAKRSFGTVWDEAVKMVDDDPTVREDLIDELKKKPRALSDKEDALLLHKQIELQNDFDKTSGKLITAQEANDPAAVAEHRVRFAQLSDQLQDVYNVGKTAGTETARGLAARKMLANEDFSLARMVTRKRAANEGRPLNEEQVGETTNLNEQILDAQKALDEHLVKQEARLKAFKTRTKGAIAKTEEKLRAGDFSKKERIPLQLDQEAFKLKGNLERLKQKFQEGLVKDIQSNRTLTEKVGDTLVKWRRGFVLSSPITLGKLTSAAAQRMVFTPIEEGIGGAISQMFPKLAEKATLEGGFSARAEAKALTEGMTKGMKDAWDVLRTGKSELDVNFQKKTGLPRSAIDFIGQVHGALKTIPKRAAFTRAMEKQFQRGIATGVDVTDPMVQSSYMIKAYQEANKSIFLQDNAVVSAWKRGMSAFEQPDKATGHVPLWKKSVATTGKVLLPIVKIPTNIVAETMRYAAGTVTGGARLARAYAKGIESLRPEEADLIMSQLKKGSIGAVVMLLGFLNPNVVGGYYQSGKKRAPGDVKAGTIRVYGHDIPSWMLHNPLLETLQIGSTIRRVAGDKMGSVPLGLAAGALGLIEEVPFVREMTEVSKAFRANEQVGFAGELAKSLVVPQALQWAAQHYDPNKETRKPRTVMEHIETGIPGLRETVPLKASSKTPFSKPFGTSIGSRWPTKP